MTREWEHAVRQGNLATLTRLIEAGADVNAKDQHGQTGLMVAAHKGHTDLVRLLLNHGADLDHTAKFHLSALMLAVLSGRTEIVRALVDSGADRSIRGSGAPGFYEKTALELAIDQQRPDLIAALQADQRADPDER